MEGPKAEITGKMFDSIAPDYDRFNHLASLGIDRTWRSRALGAIVTPHREQRILDVACGTGDFSIAIASHAHPLTTVTGIDLSEGMMEVMKCKVAAKGLGDRVSALQGNCEALPFGDGSFDRVTIAFGIRNFEHREAALREILRVLAPGGRLVILELSIPSNPVLRWLYSIYSFHIMPFIGGLLSGNRAPYRYLPASVKSFPGKKEWMETMSRCGFGNVTHKAFTFGICRMYTGETVRGC